MQTNENLQVQSPLFPTTSEGSSEKGQVLESEKADLLEQFTAISEMAGLLEQLAAGKESLAELRGDINLLSEFSQNLLTLAK